MRFNDFIFPVIVLLTFEDSAATEKGSKKLEKFNTFSNGDERGESFERFSLLHEQEENPNPVRVPGMEEDFPRKRRSDKGLISLKCTGNLTSCAGRCSKKRMFHDVEEKKEFPACYCDPQCDKIFSDCCADYFAKCGVPKKIRAKKIRQGWKCFSVKDFPYKIWMVAKCLPGWPQDDPNSIDCARFSESEPIASWITPVTAGRTTYRNRYCALCNGVKKFKTWKLDIACDEDPLRKYSRLEKMEHYDELCNASKISFKAQTRRIRYCYDVVNTCKFFKDKRTVNECKKGPTGLVSFFKTTYRNHACFLCNMNTDMFTVSCGPQDANTWRKMASSDQPLITVIFGVKPNNERLSGNEEFSPCARGQIYDHTAKLCRDLFVHNATVSSAFLERFAVRILYEQAQSNSCSREQVSNRIMSNCTMQDLLASLSSKFELYVAKTQNSTTQWRFHDLQVHLNENYSTSLVTFQILKTPSGNKTLNSTLLVEELNIGEVEVSDGNLTVCPYVLREIESKEAVCLGNQTYSVDVDDLERKNGSIYLNATQLEYKYGEYLMFQFKNETRIALCRDFKPVPCWRHLQIRNRSYWKEFSNRTIYSFTTKSWFHYGEYSVVNGTVWLCINRSYSRQRQGSIHYIILRYGNVFSYSVSIVSLSLLLLVYSLFSALRNLPGKNLMLLSAVLALGQTIWLLQDTITSQWPGLCPTLNAVLQYLYLASFSCSLAIAIQSFLTFNALAKGKLRQRSKGGTFLKYALFSLGLPFLFVLVCWILDTNEVVPFHYGASSGHCWFGSPNILYVAFLYPAFLLLLCNMSLFFATLRVIYKCTKASQKLAEKTGSANKKHVGIYLRMSTIMGFTWLCGVFNIFFPGEVAFDYVFIFVNGFQGLYLSFAFLSTANVRKIVLGGSGKANDSSLKYVNTTIKREVSTTM